jgi:hypothetical protein
MNDGLSKTDFSSSINDLWYQIKQTYEPGFLMKSIANRRPHIREKTRWESSSELDTGGLSGRLTLHTTLTTALSVRGLTHGAIYLLGFYNPFLSPLDRGNISLWTSGHFQKTVMVLTKRLS